MNIYINYIIYILFIFSFCLEAKRKNEPKKKNSLATILPAAALDHFVVICVFAFRQKLYSAPKDNGAHLKDFRPLRSEQSLFATRQQGGICLNDSELSRLYVEHSPSRRYLK